MSVQYGAISWNRQKKIYDVTLVSFLALYLALFVGLGAWRFPTATAETLLIRALGTAAFLMLHVVLCIGPLARLNHRFPRCSTTVAIWALPHSCWASRTAL